MLAVLRRGVLGDALLPSLAANVKICGTERSEPADCGGVNVNEFAVGLADAIFSGCVLLGVRLGNAELGVSGYAMENGPGVCVL